MPTLKEEQPGVYVLNYDELLLDLMWAEMYPGMETYAANLRELLGLGG